MRYCWFRQLENAHEFIENHINGKSGRSTADDCNYVIEGMQLGLHGPLNEPYNGNLESVPLSKDYLFQKYATKDPNKTLLPKNSVVRTKGL